MKLIFSAFLFLSKPLFAEIFIPAPSNYIFDEIKPDWVMKFKNSKNLTVPAGSDRMLLSTQTASNLLVNDQETINRANSLNCLCLKFLGLD